MPMSEHRTNHYMALAPETGGIEVWLDWEPEIDGDYDLPISAWREGHDLMIQPQDPAHPWPARRVELDPEEWTKLEAGGVWCLFGATGELSRRDFRLLPKH